MDLPSGTTLSNRVDERIFLDDLSCIGGRQGGTTPIWSPFADASGSMSDAPEANDLDLLKDLAAVSRGGTGYPDAVSWNFVGKSFKAPGPITVIRVTDGLPTREI